MNAGLSNLGEFPVVSIHETPFNGVDGWIKRLEDIVLSTLILSLISIPMLIIALGVKLSSSGPVFYKQNRYGLRGNRIEVWKFRTMTACEDDAEVRQVQQSDVRVTPLGAFLRRTSLDELPQFINVLQGRMSIVGPRPHAVIHNEEYRKLISGYMLRHKVRPGITGLAQVNGWRGETDTLDKMEKRIEYDLAYIKNWSLLLDVKIILLTLFKGFSGKNVY
jgi:putative colanic acid biosynthesis UDP-glucose lipid carrier transferase